MGALADSSLHRDQTSSHDPETRTGVEDTVHEEASELAVEKRDDFVHNRNILDDLKWLW